MDVPTNQPLTLVFDTETGVIKPGGGTPPMVEEFTCTAVPAKAKHGQGGRHEYMKQWTEDEDEYLRGYVDVGMRWTMIAELLGDGRTGASARNRYLRLKQAKTRLPLKVCRKCGNPKTAGHPCSRARRSVASPFDVDDDQS